MAGLKSVPCWVREMSDEDAYMALALNNAQGELHALECGMHALGFIERGKHGRSAEAYGKGVGRESEIRQCGRTGEQIGARQACGNHGGRGSSPSAP